MTPEIITALSVTVTCTTAFLVGYWHRKQLRQIELHRKDPSVGLTPAPTFLTVFFKRYFDLIGGICLPAASSLLLANTGRLTPLEALLISCNVSVILSTIAFRAHRQVWSMIVDDSREFLALHKLQKELFGSHNADLRQHGHLLIAHSAAFEGLDRRVHALEDKLAPPSPK
jgi:hypothetical protein